MRNLVAVNSPSFKKLGVELADVPDDHMLARILEEPRLLRRPLLVTADGRVLTGGRAVGDVT